MAGKTESGSGRQENCRRNAVRGAAALLLFLPFAAMQFTEEVAWDLADFIIFGAMLVTAVGAYELVERMTGSFARRAAAGVAIAAAFFLVWLNLAVGLFPG